MALSLTLLIPLLLSLSSGCALFGGSTAATTAGPPSALQTFDNLYAGAVQAETLAIQATTAALNAKLISASEAQQVLAVTDLIKAALDAANAAAQVGNSGTATANLSQAIASISIISSCLTAKPLTVATFAACTARLTGPAVQSRLDEPGVSPPKAVQS